MADHSFFQNKECAYFPCHEGVKEDCFNCLFCYCPLYSLEECPGKYKFIESKGKMVKECTECTFPHEAENYELIIALLSEN